MNVNAKVVACDFDQTIAKNGGGSYKGTRLTYRDPDGSIKEKCLHSNALKYNPTLKNQLSELKAGDDITMVLEKEGDFWNLKEVRSEEHTSELQSRLHLVCRLLLEKKKKKKKININ